jgi:ABC-type branched-subunit amino acid transport system ATPase component
MSRGASLEARNVTKSFGGLKAVDGVSFIAEPGECFGVIGPNGAGKTTLLNCLSGVLRVDSGEILWNGARIDGRPTHVRAAGGLARTFQLTEHFKSFRVLDFVLLGRSPWQPGSLLDYALWRKVARDSERRERAAALELLEQFQLADLAPMRLEDLSYGIQKRVDVARALFASPQVLLLDEPTSGVSPEERRDLEVALKSSVEAGTTRILVDHDVGFVSRNCDRILVIDHGCPVTTGPPTEALSVPEVRAAYLGT